MANSIFPDLDVANASSDWATSQVGAGGQAFIGGAAAAVTVRAVVRDTPDDEVCEMFVGGIRPIAAKLQLVPPGPSRGFSLGCD